jgi:DNA-binding transcriptional MerR regulator
MQEALNEIDKLIEENQQQAKKLSARRKELLEHRQKVDEEVRSIENNLTALDGAFQAWNLSKQKISALVAPKTLEATDKPALSVVKNEEEQVATPIEAPAATGTNSKE